MTGLQGLTQEEVQDLYKKLMLYANKRYQWITYKIPDLSAEDLVHETFKDVLQGNRNLSRNKATFEGLCEILKSKANHAWTREKGRLALDSDETGQPNLFMEVILERFYYENPHRRAVEPTEHRAIYNELCNYILRLVAGDEQLTGIVQLWFKMPDLKNQDIVSILGISEKDLHNAKKRLKLKLGTFKEVTTNV